jgi:hypothetical protein
MKILLTPSTLLFVDKTKIKVGFLPTNATLLYQKNIIRKLSACPN